MSKMDIHKIIRWWENELTGKDRTRLMGSYKWHGTVQERHQKIREIHDSAKSDSKRIEIK
ncbi:MAG TPA: hypothetical protein VMW50_02950 [Dehalococcoidia bacterium]|nr:hypothetical protein [Dehalococcoidia bacterium]